MNAIEISYCVVKEWNVVTVRLTKEGAERVHRLQGEGRTFCLACELPLGKIGDKEQRTLTRKQADALLAGAQLVVDPLSGMFEVRP